MQGSRANVAHAFVQLPFEVLTEILLGSISPSDLSKGTKRLWTLARVCQRFWRIILAEARFWCHITSADLDQVHIQLLRSGSHPLFVSLDSRNGMSAAHVRYFVELVGVMYQRWETLMLDVDPNHAHIVKPLVEKCTSRLKELRLLTHPTCPWSCLQIENLPGRALLKSVWLGGIQVMNWTGGINENITTLKLERVKFWPEGFSGMLEACPNIESLEIDHLHALQIFYPSIHRVALPRLHRLVVKSPVVGAVLFCVMAENLQILHAEQQHHCDTLSQSPAYAIDDGDVEDESFDFSIAAIHAANPIPPFIVDTFMTERDLGPLIISGSRASVQVRDTRSNLRLSLFMDDWEETLAWLQAMLNSSKCHLTLHLSNFHNLFMFGRVKIRAITLPSPRVVEGVIAFLGGSTSPTQINLADGSIMESNRPYPLIEEMHLPLLNWKEMSKIRPLLQKMLSKRAEGHSNETKNGETYKFIKLKPIRIYACDGREVDLDWAAHQETAGSGQASSLGSDGSSNQSQ